MITSVVGHTKVKRAVMVALTESIPVMLIYGAGSGVPDVVTAANRLAQRLNIPFTAITVLRCSCGGYLSGVQACRCSASTRLHHCARMRRLAVDYIMFCDDNEDTYIRGDYAEFGEKELVVARGLPPPQLPPEDLYIDVLRRFVRTYRYLDHFGLQMTASAVARLNQHPRIEVSDIAEALSYQYSTIAVFQNLRAAVKYRHQPREEREQLIQALIEVDLEVRNWIIGKVLRHGFKGYDNMTMDELEAVRKLKV